MNKLYLCIQIFFGMNLPKIHSISKKILVALLGAFLSVFLLFHASANLCILRNDGGEWYNAFCDFMEITMLAIDEPPLAGSIT